MRKQIVTALLVLSAAVVVLAHVTISPGESKLGASERYTVHVPTEGQVSTVGVDLDVPEGVTISGVQAVGGWTSEIRREGPRVMGISWKLDIPPAQFADLVFTARNPAQGTQIAWKVRQRFADGTNRDWTPATKLVPATVHHNYFR